MPEPTSTDIMGTTHTPLSSLPLAKLRASTAPPGTTPTTDTDSHTVDSDVPGFSELQERLIKKELISRQMATEFDVLSANPHLLRSLCYVSPMKRSPFLETPACGGPTLDALRLSKLVADARAASRSRKGNEDDGPISSLPFFSFLFSVIFTFPFVDRAGTKFVTAMDTFIKEMLDSRGGYSSTVERGGEQTNVLPRSHRKAFKGLLKKVLVFLFDTSIKTPKQNARIQVERDARSTAIATAELLNSPFGAPGESAEEVDRDDRAIEFDDCSTLLSRCEFEVEGRMRVNIPTVRFITYKKHVRFHHRADFLISTTIKSEKENVSYCVCRSYRDFVLLRKRIDALFPTLELPPVPPRSRDQVTPCDHAGQKDADNSSRSVVSEMQNRRLHEITRLRLRDFLKSLIDAVPRDVMLHSPAEEEEETGDSASSEPVTTQVFALPAPLVEFLTADSARTVMTAEEEEDAHFRAKAEVIARNERKRIEKEVGERARLLVERMREFMNILMQKGGLTKVFKAIAEVDHVHDLPPRFQCVIEWASINFAFSLLEMFSDPVRGPERLATAKRVNAVVPYRALAAIMRWTNPLAVAKGVINLLLKRPPWPGGKSIFQQMVTAGIGDEIEVLESKCNAVVLDAVEKVLLVSGASSEADKAAAKKSVEAAVERLRNYVADNERMERLPRCEDATSLVRHILMHPYYGDTPLQIVETVDGSTATPASSMVGLPEKETLVDFIPASATPSLVAFMALESARRDKIAIKELAEHAATAELVKEIIGLFYGPLMDLYRLARADQMIILGGCFMKDMITVSSRVVERSVSNAALASPMTASSADLQAYLDLLGRHVTGFYAIAHALHAEPGSVLGECVRWCDASVGWLRGSRVDLDFETSGVDEETPVHAASGWMRTLEIEILVRELAEDVASGKATVKIEGVDSSDPKELEEGLMRKLKDDARKLEECRESKKKQRQRKVRKKVSLAAGMADTGSTVTPLEPAKSDVAMDAAAQQQSWGEWLRGGMGMMGSWMKKPSEDNSTSVVHTTSTLPPSEAVNNHAEGSNSTDLAGMSEVDADESLINESEAYVFDNGDDDEGTAVSGDDVPASQTENEKYFHAVRLLPNSSQASKQALTLTSAGTTPSLDFSKSYAMKAACFPSIMSSKSSFFFSGSDASFSTDSEGGLTLSEGNMLDELALEKDNFLKLEEGNGDDNTRGTRRAQVAVDSPSTRNLREGEAAKKSPKARSGSAESVSATRKRGCRPPPELEVVPLLQEKFRELLLGGFLT